MKKLFKEYWIFIAILAIPYLFIVISSFVKVNYDLTAPASITEVSENMEIAHSKQTNVHSVSFYSYSKISFLSYLLGTMNPYATIEETYEYQITDNQIEYQSGLIQKKVSIYNSIIAGYQKAGINEIVDQNSFQGYIIHTLYKFSPVELKVGDIITSFNHVAFTTCTQQNEFSKVCSELTYEEGKTYPITVIRDGKLLEFNISAKATNLDGNQPVFGISTYAYNVPVIFNEYNPYYYEWDYGNSIGPSAGLMQSLYVYEALTNYRLTSGLKIVGTGTVDIFGYAGPIGGIYQKVITAHLSGADIFFVPVSSMNKEEYIKESNYQEAYASYQQLKNPKMQLIPVASLDDIINYLESVKEQ